MKPRFGAETVILLLAGSSAALLGGCSVAASGQLSRVVYDADNPAGQRYLPDERSLNRGVMFGGRLHLPQTKPIVLGGETALLNESGAPCCQWRVNLLAGVSSLPIERPELVGAEAFAAATFTSLPVDADNVAAFGIGPRFGFPIGLPFLRWGLPCEDDPYATLSILIVPEVGASAFLPVDGPNRELQLETQAFLSVRVHGWTGLIE